MKKLNPLLNSVLYLVKVIQNYQKWRKRGKRRSTYSANMLSYNVIMCQKYATYLIRQKKSHFHRAQTHILDHIYQTTPAVSISRCEKA